MDLETLSSTNAISKTLGGSSQAREVTVQTPKSIKIKTENGEERVEADTVILAAGPWTGGLATTLLGNKIGGKLAVSGSRAHSIVLKTKEPLTAHCLFTSMNMADGSVGEPEVYARPDGSYMCILP
jgi:glycine/D-amino acid oxidase-like deaminating enzyme